MASRDTPGTGNTRTDLGNGGDWTLTDFPKVPEQKTKTKTTNNLAWSATGWSEKKYKEEAGQCPVAQPLPSGSIHCQMHDCHSSFLTSTCCFSLLFQQIEQKSVRFSREKTRKMSQIVCWTITSINQSITLPQNQSINQSTTEPINQSINRMIKNQSINQSIKWSRINQSINQSNGQC